MDDGFENLLIQVVQLRGRTSASLDELIEFLQSKTNVGLEDAELVPVLTLLTSDPQHLTIKSFKSILYACIPVGFINNDVIDIVLLWLLSSCQKDSRFAAKRIASLEWLTGLLEFNLVEKKHVDSYYNLYYSLLDYRVLQKSICKLLYYLTRPEDVYKGRVNKVYQFHLQNGKKKFTSSLLGLFKLFKPELVPQNVQMFHVDQSFGRLPEELKVAFQLTQSRLNEEHAGFRNFSTCLPIWKGVSSSKTGLNVIPSASYIHVGSQLYRQKKQEITKFFDKKSIAAHQLNIEMPSCVASLLLNEVGIHVLSTFDFEIHSRFSSVLFSTLQSVFFSNRRSFSYEDRDKLLEKVVSLEEYMQQGIPVVSRFLAIYIGSWNGLDHREYVYKLLEFVTFSSYDELYQCLLVHLKTLFLCASIVEKCTIINTLRTLTCNLIFTCDCFKLKKNFRPTFFLGDKQQWDADIDSSIPKLFQFMSDLCNQGLLLTSNDPIMLHTVLSFYESVLDIQIQTGRNMLVISPYTFYEALFSAHFSNFSRACNLLVRYKESEEYLGTGTQQISQNKKWLNDYSCDIWNCFLNEKAFKKGNQGYVFQSDGEKLQDLFERDSAFCLKNHLISFSLEIALKHVSSSMTDTCPPEILLEYIQNLYPNVARCSDAITKIYSNYH